MKLADGGSLEFVEESRLARALWIEIILNKAFHTAFVSRLARALWIEITISIAPANSFHVEARESLVD